jgi:hypothetical protein
MRYGFDETKFDHPLVISHPGNLTWRTRPSQDVEKLSKGVGENGWEVVVLCVDHLEALTGRVKQTDPQIWLATLSSSWLGRC